MPLIQRSPPQRQLWITGEIARIATQPACRGSVTVTVVPRPTSLSTPIVPPWATTAASAIDMPEPAPAAVAGPRRIGAVEALGHLGRHVRRHARTVVGDGERGPSPSTASTRSSIGVPGRRVHEGVADDVGDDLAQAVLVAQHDHRALAPSP